MKGQDMTTISVVTFAIGDTLLAFPVTLVEDVLPLRPVLPVPDAPAHILGTFRHSGTEILLLDLTLLLGQKPQAPTPLTRVLLLRLKSDSGPWRMAVRVDCVMDVTFVAADQVSLLPEELRQLWA
jgi:purine-binding chemotaxis protein CheW